MIIGQWSLVIGKEAEAKTKAEKREKRKETEKEFKSQPFFSALTFLLGWD